jgi:glutamyl-tRNA reductase
LINQNRGKAADLANELALQYASMDQLDMQVGGADIILVATNATEPVIIKNQLENKGRKIILDLSIPYNVEKEA